MCGIEEGRGQPWGFFLPPLRGPSRRRLSCAIHLSPRPSRTRRGVYRRRRRRVARTVGWSIAGATGRLQGPCPPFWLRVCKKWLPRTSPTPMWSPSPRLPTASACAAPGHLRPPRDAPLAAVRSDGTGRRGTLPKKVGKGAPRRPRARGAVRPELKKHSRLAVRERSSGSRAYGYAPTSSNCWRSRTRSWLLSCRMAMVTRPSGVNGTIHAPSRRK